MFICHHVWKEKLLSIPPRLQIHSIAVVEIDADLLAVAFSENHFDLVAAVAAAHDVVDYFAAYAAAPSSRPE